MNTQSPFLKPFILTIFLLSMLATAIQPALAFEEGEGYVKREINIQVNKSYEISIGNGGVFLDNSRHIGTLRIQAYKAANRGWHVFTQRLLDIHVYDKEGKAFDSVFGLVRVYFNLDGTQRKRWNDKTNNMSIWRFDEVNGGWRKCVTHLVEEAGFSHGRLYCLVKSYGLFGLAYTKPTLIIKLEKAK